MSSIQLDRQQRVAIYIKYTNTQACVSGGGGATNSPQVQRPRFSVDAFDCANSLACNVAAIIVVKAATFVVSGNLQCCRDNLICWLRALPCPAVFRTAEQNNLVADGIIKAPRSAPSRKGFFVISRPSGRVCNGYFIRHVASAYRRVPHPPSGNSSTRFSVSDLCQSGPVVERRDCIHSRPRGNRAHRSPT